MTKQDVLRVSSSSRLESKLGYSQVVVHGNQIEVAGTIATDLDGDIVGPDNIYLQTKYIIEKVKAALLLVECDLDKVIRTRMFTTNIKKWEDIGRAHKEYFKDIRPAATLIEVSKLIIPKALIEIEFTAKF